MGGLVLANEDIRITVDDNGIVHIIGTMNARVKALLRDAIFDIADEIEKEAKYFAPDDKDPDAYSWRDRPGRGRTLKEHPVDVFKSRGAGRVEDIASFGGGFSVRGAGGRFVSGGAPASLIGQEIDGVATVSIARDPHYAIFVHDGTSAHTPVTSPFMVYKSFGKWHRRTYVRGQEPQPYLTEAYETVNTGYANIRVEKLRAEIDAAT